MEWFLALDGVDELESAEDFLNHFSVEHQPEKVRVIRLHLMHRYHELLAEQIYIPADQSERFALAKALLAKTYQIFDTGTVSKQSGFRVYRRLDPLFFPLSQLSEVTL